MAKDNFLILVRSVSAPVMERFMLSTGICYHNAFLLNSCRDNCRVQILSSEGIFLRQLGEKGAGPGQLISPYWCTIDVEGNVIVPDFGMCSSLNLFNFLGNNRVNIFDFSGNLLLTFGQSLKSPAAVTIDADGNLFIGDFGNNQLVVWG